MKLVTQTWLDRLSISASTVCAIHCAAMPTILALFPTLSFLPSDDHAFHEALVWLIVPMSLLAVFMGCKKHKDKAVLIGILSGLTLLVSTAFFAHDLVGEVGEKVATVVATFILAIAHWRNYSLCRKRSCHH
ncbi:MAG: MerC domain-containing protein [Paraglaciecola sp.]|uniref:MerC domain-containing protein n=1 Tax=Paraglaciecola sp. TaxID=1920173 RepID=UPI00329A4E11